MMAEDEARWAKLRRRQRWTTHDAAWALDALARSGKSVSDFAQERGLSKTRLYAWRQRLDLRAQARPKRQPGVPNRQPVVQTQPVSLVPVTVRPTRTPAVGECAVVVSTGNVRVEVRELSAASRFWVAGFFGLGDAS